jgi:uncharacterized protein DUF2652
MASKGYFVITDISGYTEYLTQSELDHANETLQGLFEAQLAQIHPPLLISGFRGDAIFMYAPETGFVQPQSFVESLENLYFVFADTLRQMKFNTTCTCRACRNMGNLDLKMCVHYGEYLVQKLGDREELLGADVIVPHRMLKNNVIEQTGVKAYAVFSDSAAQALDLPALCTDLRSHTETYEHLGEVRMSVHDLHLAWEQEQARRRTVVEADRAWVKFEGDEVPYPPSLVWDYLTVPELEARVLGFDMAERIDALGGRVRPEAQIHCAHGDLHVFSTILDWKPFEYYTSRQTGAGLAYLQTRRLIPSEHGCRLAVYLGRPESPEHDIEEIRIMMAGYMQLWNGLGTTIGSDVAAGKVSLPAPQDTAARKS